MVDITPCAYVCRIPKDAHRTEEHPFVAPAPLPLDTRMPRPMAWYRAVKDDELYYGYLISPAEARRLATPEPTEDEQP